jgi:hypothetical protein
MHFIEDKYQELARKDLIYFLNRKENKTKAFYSHQLEIIFEDKYYHWITNRAL